MLATLCGEHLLGEPAVDVLSGVCLLLASFLNTVNVYIFALLNFRASGPRWHFGVDKFSRI